MTYDAVPRDQPPHPQQPTSPPPAGPPGPEIWTDVRQPKIRRKQTFARELIETVLLIAAIYAFVNLATARFVVDGNSMQPNFASDQFIIVSRLSYILGEPRRGDVVVFHYPGDTSRDFIKRVIGLPGETVTIQDGLVYIDGKLIEEPYIENYCRAKSCDGEWEISEDQYFVLGDNRGASKDSQDFGPVDRKYFVGRAFVRYWPPSDWGLIEHWSFSNNGAPLPTVTPTFTPTVTPTATATLPWTGHIPHETPAPTPTRPGYPGNYSDDYWSTGVE